MNAPDMPSHLASLPTQSTLDVPQETDITTITFACHDWARPEFKRLAEIFHETNPNIRVQIVAIEDIIAFGPDFDYITGTYQIVSAADTASWAVSQEATERGLIRDLAPFIDADTGFGREDFYPNMIEFFQWNGGVWALPTQAELTLIFYDKDIFAESGVAYPSPDWTPEEFLIAAQQLTRRDGDTVTRFGFVPLSLAAPTAFIESQIGSLVDDSTGPSVPRLNTPQVANAIRWYTDLALKYGVMPNPALLPQGGEELYDLVNSGRAAMWADSMINFESMSRSRNVGLAPFPSGQQAANPLYMYGYLMSSGTKHPQESWRWLTFLTRQRIIGPVGSFLSSIPARHSVAEASYYWARWDDETARAIQYALEHASVRQGEASRAIRRAIEDVFAGKPVEEALAERQAKMTEILLARTQLTPLPPVVVAAPRRTGAEERTVISFAPVGPDADAYRQLAAIFNEEHADIRVQVVTPNEVDSADCFAGSHSVIDAKGRERLLNLQPLIAADTAFSLDDFHSHFLDAFRYQGDLWGLPTQAQVLVIFYNRGLFDEADVPYPEPGWTLDDFLARALALTRGSGDEKQYGFIHLYGDYVDLPVFVTLQGARLWGDDNRPRFDAPDVVEAVRWYADLALKHGVTPIFPNDNDLAIQETRDALVRNGRVAMWTEIVGFNLDRSDNWPADAEIEMVPLPTDAEKVTMIAEEGLFIASDTPHVEACWEWLKFASVQAGPIRGMPARRSILESATFASQAGQNAVNTYRAMLRYADVSIPPTAEASSQLHWLYQALADILMGVQPEIALAEAQLQAEGIGE